MSERAPQTESELVELVRSIDVQAPADLHRRVETLVQERSGVRRRRPRAIRWGLAGVPVLCALVLVLVLGSSGGGSTLTLERTVALTLRPATTRAPVESAHDGAQLAADVDGIPFPYWEESFGWRATGARVDRVDGRAVTTVFYANREGRWIGYAIVAGTPAPGVSGGVIMYRRGTPYRFLVEHGAHVVTWLRDGHLCVVAGHGVSTATLLSLASWHGGGTIAS
jgi:hypothetical protein